MLVCFPLCSLVLSCRRAFLPANEKFLRLPSRSLLLVAKAPSSSGIQMFPIGQCIEPCIDLWIVDPFPCSSRKQVPKGQMEEQPRAQAPAQQDRQDGVWGRGKDGGLSTREEENPRPHVHSESVLRLYTSHATCSHNNLMMLCGSFYYPPCRRGTCSSERLSDLCKITWFTFQLLPFTVTLHWKEEEHLWGRSL